MRILTLLLGDGLALQVARSLEEVDDVLLDVLVQQAVERGDLHAQAVRFATSLERALSRHPNCVDRAVRNLLDNAAK